MLLTQIETSNFTFWLFCQVPKLIIHGLIITHLNLVMTREAVRWCLWVREEEQGGFVARRHFGFESLGSKWWDQVRLLRWHEGLTRVFDTLWGSAGVLPEVGLLSTLSQILGCVWSVASHGFDVYWQTRIEVVSLMRCGYSLWIINESLFKVQRGLKDATLDWPCVISCSSKVCLLHIDILNFRQDLVNTSVLCL